MLGVAIGDALGAPLEFMKAEEIKAKYGTVREMLGGGWLNVIPGEVTDDTQMTLAVTFGIQDNPNDPIPAIGKRFIEWRNSNPKDIGGTCDASISTAEYCHAKTAEDWFNAAEKVSKISNGRTAGNGALMRTIYPALYYNSKYAGAYAESIGAMTHSHVDSGVALFNYTTAISEILEAPEEIDVEWAKERLEFRMKAVRDRLKGKENAPQPTGYVIDSAVCAINAIRDTSSFEDAVVYAVNLGGDADTIGAITGGLAGAIYGSKAIPLRWINALANARNNALFGNENSNCNLLAMGLINAAHKAYKRRTDPTR